jgi:hypothetical protein
MEVAEYTKRNGFCPPDDERRKYWWAGHEDLLVLHQTSIPNTWKFGAAPGRVTSGALSQLETVMGAVTLLDVYKRHLPHNSSLCVKCVKVWIADRDTDAAYPTDVAYPTDITAYVNTACERDVVLESLLGNQKWKDWVEAGCKEDEPIASAIISRESVTLNVEGCARCRGRHTLIFTAFKDKLSTGKHSHWATCPTTGEPVLLMSFDE